jgi:hypothetical protein
MNFMPECWGFQKDGAIARFRRNRQPESGAARAIKEEK